MGDISPIPTSSYPGLYPQACAPGQQSCHAQESEAAASRSAENSRPADDETGTGNTRLSVEEHKVVQELKAIDREVRSHEAAHMAAAGGLAKGGASYSFQRGPDGQQYAIGGEVSIDVSSVAGDPQATLQKANAIISAALAPAQPSTQDRAVAAQAAQMAAEARIEIIRQRLEENRGQKQGPAALYEDTRHDSDPANSMGSLLDISA